MVSIALSLVGRGPLRGSSGPSDLAALEIDPRIDPGVGEVGDELHDEAHQRKDVERREDDRVVAVHHALEAEQAEPVEREDRLDEQRSGEEGGDEGARESRR